MGCHPTFPDMTQSDRAALMRAWQRIEALREVCREAHRTRGVSRGDRDRFDYYRCKLNTLEMATVFAFPEIRLERLPTVVESPYRKRLELTEGDRPEEGQPPKAIARRALVLARKIAAVACKYPELDHDLEAMVP